MTDRAPSAPAAARPTPRRPRPKILVSFRDTTEVGACAVPPAQIPFEMLAASANDRTG